MTKKFLATHGFDPLRTLTLRAATLCAASLALLVTFVALPAAAQEEEAARPLISVSERDAEARARFDAGRLAFEDGRFEEALENFEASFELSERPTLLYNIGVAQDRLRRPSAALESFERYLAQLPDAANAREVHARIALLRQDGAPPRTDAVAERARPRFAWIALGTAVIAGGVGVALYANVRSIHGDLEASCPSRCAQSTIDDSGGPRRQRASRAMLGVTAVAAAASVVLFAVETRSGRHVQVRAGFEGFGIRGKF